MPNEEARVIRMEVDTEDAQFLEIINNMRELLEELIAPVNYETWGCDGFVRCPYCSDAKKNGEIQHNGLCPIKRAKDLLDREVRVPMKWRDSNEND